MGRFFWLDFEIRPTFFIPYNIVLFETLLNIREFTYRYFYFYMATYLSNPTVIFLCVTFFKVKHIVLNWFFWILRAKKNSIYFSLQIIQNKCLKVIYGFHWRFPADPLRDIAGLPLVTELITSSDTFKL